MTKYHHQSLKPLVPNPKPLTINLTLTPLHNPLGSGGLVIKALGSLITYQNAGKAPTPLRPLTISAPGEYFTP